jgi:DNA-binding MarR family transcriptional regulator
MTGQREHPIPLARLLALAYRELIEKLHARLEQEGYADVRPAFGYVLLAAREQPITGAEVALLLGESKQAASKQVAAMEHAGYVRRRTHGEDGRAKAIEITARGRQLLVTVESIYGELESHWARVTSRRRVEGMRRDLRAVVEAAHGGELPAVRRSP